MRRFLYVIGDDVDVPVISTITRISPTAANFNVSLDPDLSADALIKVSYYNAVGTSHAQVTLDKLKHLELGCFCK